jgi:hypothetical protein
MHKYARTGMPIHDLNTRRHSSGMIGPVIVILPGCGQIADYWLFGWNGGDGRFRA